jgi:hypothetical protein
VFRAVAAVAHLRSGARPVLWWVVIAGVLYLTTVVITMVVDVPLNDAIKAAGDPDRIACLVWMLILHGRETGVAPDPSGQVQTNTSARNPPPAVRTAPSGQLCRLARKARDMSVRGRPVRVGTADKGSEKTKKEGVAVVRRIAVRSAALAATVALSGTLTLAVTAGKEDDVGGSAMRSGAQVSAGQLTGDAAGSPATDGTRVTVGDGQNW